MTSASCRAMRFACEKLLSLNLFYNSKKLDVYLLFNNVNSKSKNLERDKSKHTLIRALPILR